MNETSSTIPARKQDGRKGKQREVVGRHLRPHRSTPLVRLADNQEQQPSPSPPAFAATKLNKLLAAILHPDIPAKMDCSHNVKSEFRGNCVSHSLAGLTKVLPYEPPAQCESLISPNHKSGHSTKQQLDTISDNLHFSKIL